MVYSYVAHYSKKIVHWGVDNTFPSTAGIATVSAAAGYWSYNMGMTYAPGYLSTLIINELKNKFGTAGSLAGYSFAAPAIVPWATPYVATYMSIGVSCATSFTLNMIAKHVFKIKSDYKDKRLEQPPPPEVKSYLALTNKKKSHEVSDEDFDEEDFDEEDYEDEEIGDEELDPFETWSKNNKKAELKKTKFKRQPPEETYEPADSFLSGECFSQFCS